METAKEFKQAERLFASLMMGYFTGKIIAKTINYIKERKAKKLHRELLDTNLKLQKALTSTNKH